MAVIDMASYEHLRRKRIGSEPYTCSETGVTFPPIYKVLIPDADEINGAAVFSGTFSPYYQLSQEPRDSISEWPGFPESKVTEISTLDKGDEFYLDVIYFKDKKVAQGFIEACYHFGMMSGYVSKKSTEKGVFVLLTRTDDRRKDACILYHTSGHKLIELMNCEMPCNYVATFNYLGELIATPPILDGEI
mgnify:CR=1 FL=1|jgi:hypothetical protein|tara:strand:- start:148 stop:717 length:570 start_codon:yes stop_codon:yes gene_type:complete